MKTAMQCLFLLMGAVMLPMQCVAQLTDNSPLFIRYREMNNEETRLAEFRDSDSDLLLKLNQLEIINTSRKRHKAPPVQLDILASRVANRMCAMSAAGGYISHWNEDGEKPYHRYAFAGGVDHVTENASGESFTGFYTTDDNTKAEMMRKYHEVFMAEKAPANGHKLNIIDKNHNYVGLGLWLDKHQFRYYEEFIDRYITFINPPREVKAGQQFFIELETEQGNFLSYLAAFYEKGLRKSSIPSLMQSGSYSDYSDITATEINPWILSGYRKGNSYKVPLKFNKPGLYYIHLYLDTREYSGSGSFSTEGKIQASGLVIRVL